MPTTRRRHMLTESDALTDALNAAAREWPEDADFPSRLLLRLIEEGRRSVAGDDAIARRRRVDIVHRNAGALSGWFGVDYLEELREDWPE